MTRRVPQPRHDQPHDLLRPRRDLTERRLVDTAFTVNPEAQLLELAELVEQGLVSPDEFDSAAQDLRRLVGVGTVSSAG